MRRTRRESSLIEEGHLRLKTDFRDYYDQWFAHRDSDFPLYTRTAKTRVRRREELMWLNRWGLRTPLRGKVKDIAARVRKKSPAEPFIVVYLNEYEHIGEGKVLVSVAGFSSHASIIETSHPTKFSTQWIPSGKKPVSYRFLKVGGFGDEFSVWMRYESQTDEWRSNSGDVRIDILPGDPRPQSQRAPIDIPSWGIFAIDFVRHEETGAFYAIDWNPAPLVRNTGIEDLVRAEEVYDLIRFCYHRRITR